jgi:hypothetical protein
MTSDTSKYLSLMSKFISNEMSTVDFQTSYLDLFKNESEQLDSASFEVLDALFGDIDSFVLDPELRAELESQNPGFYLDEPALRRRVADACRELRKS